MTMTDNNPQVKSIKVQDLFGLYNHSVVLNDDRVTVIHGPNGVGKTVFLKLTDALLRGRYYEIARVPFSTFEILFADTSLIRVRIEDEPNSERKVHLEFRNADGHANSSILEGAITTPKFASEIADRVPYITQVSVERWIDIRTDEVLTAEDVLNLGNEFLPKESKRWQPTEPEGLREFRSRINIHLIEAQRLIRFADTNPQWRRKGSEYLSRNTVQEYSMDLKKSLGEALANYGKHSQKLDQTFPQRLLQGSVEPLTIDQLKGQMQNVEETRERLKRMGILDGGDGGQDFYPLQISELDALQAGQLSVMSVYASDTKSKLAILEELSGRIEILLTVLNRKFANKKVTVSRESGLAIVGLDGKPIPITALSSGEQHELVLLYDLLFKVKRNTLVLIDEPELSLHISWQKNFMNDLLEIIKLAHFDVLMATHSPYIVGDRSDLLVILSADLES